MTKPRFKVEIDTIELGYILNGYDDDRSRLQRQIRIAKKSEKLELINKMTALDARYNQLSTILDQQAD